jgi:hypothetical protein
MPRQIAQYDKTGGTTLLKAIKTNVFRNVNIRFTRERCEAFLMMRTISADVPRGHAPHSFCENTTTFAQHVVNIYCTAIQSRGFGRQLRGGEMNRTVLPLPSPQLA